MENLKFIRMLRECGAINRYTSTFVIQDRNFREIPEFIDRSLNEFGFDDVLFRPVYQWGTMDEKVFWFKDILNPAHPYHKEYLCILKHPLMKDSRVYNFGGESFHLYRDFQIVEECNPQVKAAPKGTLVILPEAEAGRKVKLWKGIKMCASAILGQNLTNKVYKLLRRPRKLQQY
jgi:hypothetical protein